MPMEDSKAGGFGTFVSEGSDIAGYVLLWDENPDRRQKISDILSEGNVRPLIINKVSDLCLAESSESCSVAVVGTGPMAAGTGMKVIRDLKAKGFKVIACENEAESWPIKTKCLPLLAGAIHLFDSAKADFPRELSGAVERIVRAEKQQRSEEYHIRSIMHGLGMVGESQTMMAVFRTIIRFSALSDLPVLILGETGTGKEGLARALHRLDPKRNQGPFVPVNCGAITAALADSEFFGHCRGAFTGAERQRKGLIRSAEGGVLFLDEIAELDAMLQTRFLRVLQENRVLGVGEDREVEVSVRVIAASNRDLEQMVQQNRFRADLFHRLNILSIRLPPLHERLEDIPALVEFFLEKYHALVPVAMLAAGSDFLDALRQLRMPGNVRQLENLVRQALVRSGGNSPLSLSDLPIEALRQLFAQEPTPINPPTDESEGADAFVSGNVLSWIVCLLEANGWNLTRSLENCERHALEAAMLRTRGNQSKTARLLGITPRSVYNKVHKYRLKS
jgi:DNA-binding NtrC family response regulator